MLGERLRKRRIELRLSQQQVAGNEMTRSFVSLLETGRCMPSPETLRLIAQRLGKPVEFFLHDEEDDGLEIASALIHSARQDIAELHQPATALRKLQKVKEFALSSNRVDLEIAARKLTLEVLNQQQQNDAFVAECQLLLENYRTTGDRSGIAETNYTMGCAMLQREEFAEAKRYFEQAALYTVGLKTMQGLHVEALTYLGSSLFRLGEVPAAIGRYHEALKECAHLNVPQFSGRIAMGLGWALFTEGDATQAQRWTERAIAEFQKAKSLDKVLAEHNLALMQASRGNWEQAYVMLQSCLLTFRDRGQIERQASTVEDLARYWLHKGNTERAEQLCWEGMALLNIRDDGVVRGRLYRLLGEAARRRGDFVHARAYLQISFDLLRRLKASHEAARSSRDLEALLQQMETDQRAK